jgi:cytochrome bd-type quinol oxidase subunit 2
MSIGDLIWGMIVGYILLGAVWLALERIGREAKRRRRSARRSAGVVDLASLRATRTTPGAAQRSRANESARCAAEPKAERIRI